MKSNVKLLFMDVDGTLTDGNIYMSASGESFKSFHIKDGYGIHDILPQFGIVPIIITARESKIVEMRCKELEIKNIFQGCKNKKNKMIEIAERYGIKENPDGFLIQTAYIGDDIPDIECMKIAEYTGCPVDAVQQIKNIADFVAEHKGGDGAVREFIEWLVR